MASTTARLTDGENKQDIWHCFHFTNSHTHTLECYARTGFRNIFSIQNILVNSKAVTNESPSHGKHLVK